MYEGFILKKREGNVITGDPYSLGREGLVITECTIVDTNKTIVKVNPAYPIAIGTHTIGGIVKACIEELQMTIPIVITFEGSKHIMQVTGVKELEGTKKEVTIESDVTPNPITATYEVQR